MTLRKTLGQPHSVISKLSPDINQLIEPHLKNGMPSRVQFAFIRPEEKWRQVFASGFGRKHEASKWSVKHPVAKPVYQFVAKGGAPQISRQFLGVGSCTGGKYLRCRAGKQLE